MKVLRLVVVAGFGLVAGLSVSGCGAGGGGGTGGSGGAASGGAPGSGGASATGGRAATGGATSTGGAPSTGSGGTFGSGGVPASGGGPGSGGAGSPSGGQGGTLPGSGGAAAGGSGGRGGTGGGPSTGTGGATAMPRGGSSARFICQSGATYGNPLSGMGSVQQIAAPQGDYFAFIEGPIWIGSAGTGTVFFSDNASSPQERIWKVVPPATAATQFMAMSGSNGLAVDNNDRLIVADQRNRRITRVDPANGTMLGVVAMTSAKPNDVIVRSDDNMYFTDPDTGFYRISPTGTVSAAMNVMQGSRPNGIELSLDENTLYVGDVGNKSITKFAVAADGSVMMGTAAPFATTMNNTTDGMCVDCAGNVYASTANGVEVYSPAGQYIGTVPTGEASNCTFGGADRKTLYVTSRSVLKYVTLGVPGLPD